MVIIEAFSSEQLVEKISVSVYDYYDEDIALIDDDKYRKDNKIDKIIISIYPDDENADLHKKSVCFYDNEGKYSSDSILFEKQIIEWLDYSHIENLG